MKNIILSGNKEVFAIQIETGSKPDKNKVCYWVSGNKVGNFTRVGEIKNIKKSFQQFDQHNEEFYLPQLEPFHTEQLRDFFFEGLFKLVNSNSIESLEEFKHRQSLCLNWGIQVDGYNVILLAKPNHVLFFYTPPNKGSKLNVIPNDIFRSVFTEFLRFCDEHMLV
ncbi:hypothetical protein L3C95_16020 [Chitinophaga filiformis]|uniref:hypothetical protein n=1 Tax=Chitinophaga filiformis TaxID=104663 RepID=UPI001F40480D|nr:hypothetical protein [Chitinophaga filiformis]MCF6404405.1 hypothetical protein [Chitinophaga filiformis]